MTVIDNINLVDDESFAHLTQQVFSNNLILQEISKTFSINDLKSFRLVSILCHDASLSVWRKQAVVCLGPYKGWGKLSVQEFMERLEKPEDLTSKTFCNYTMLFNSLPPVNLTEQELDGRPDFKFWKECGPSMKHLHLKHGNYNEKKLSNLLCNLTPNLESLVIRCVNKKSLGGAQLEDGLLRRQEKLKVLHVCGRLPFSNWRFLKYFPNLKEIVLRNPSNNNLIQDLNALRMEDQRILNLECLDIIQTQQSMEGLAEARLPLKHLSIRLERDVTEIDLQRVMESQAPTLRSLKLFRFPLANWSPLSPIPLQVNFTSLKELHLWGKVVSNLNFLKWMPSLKTLVIDLACHEKALEIYEYSTLGADGRIESCYDDMIQTSYMLTRAENFTLEHLESFQMDLAISHDSLSELRRWMPNLKVFKSILNNATLRQVCRQWPKLEQLKLLYGSDVSDEGITGMTLASTVGKEERQPNLTDLKDLRTFELLFYCDMSPLSDASARHAFLAMPHLENLRICVSKKMTTSAEELLKKTIKHVEIFRNYDKHHSNLHIKCCDRVSFFLNNQSLQLLE